MDFHSDVKNGLIHILLLAALQYDARKRVNRRLVAAQRIGATGGLPIVKKVGYGLPGRV